VGREADASVGADRTAQPVRGRKNDGQHAADGVRCRQGLKIRTSGRQARMTGPTPAKRSARHQLSARQVKVTVIAALVLGFLSSLFQLVLDIRNEVTQRESTVA
jgi:hypothetical protein